MRDGKRLFRRGAALCCGGMLVCGGLFLRQWREYRVGEQAYQDLTERVVQQKPVSEQTVPFQQTAPVRPHVSARGEDLPQVDFEALEVINPDVVGWLYSSGTGISYPVAQGEDNTYYLNHLFDGTPNSAGCLFLDSRCQGLEGRNSVIYGHYMNNGTLFASLKEYQDQAYYDAHPRLYLLTPEGTLTIALFSAYVAGPEGEAWQLDFSASEDYGAWLERIRAQSCFESELIPQVTDRVITLSTCNYTFPNARFVCHGLVCEGRGSQP